MKKKRSTAEKSLEKKLKQLRSKIDQSDRALIRALGARQSIVRKIGILKAKTGMAPLQSARWKEVIEARIALGHKAKLSEEFTESLFNLIHAESVRIQEALKTTKKTEMAPLAKSKLGKNNS